MKLKSSATKRSDWAEFVSSIRNDDALVLLLKSCFVKQFAFSASGELKLEIDASPFVTEELNRRWGDIIFRAATFLQLKTMPIEPTA